ncbi:class I adenylate-forming enzyme family protein [Rhabdothermincola sediminis]|uniref:class I adenylate-forming enzyme family protein n=1 Tax=Rhabdothermincola sediminis TaxID=2751370 RepID=UPI001AA06BAF|nr:AMP-binding protein [Rhabdothermincola sediminis]
MLREIVRAAGARFGELAAFVRPDGSALTYAGLDHRSDSLAAGLHAAGIGEGDVVALTLPSDVDYVIAYTAATKVGAITAGVNPRLTAAERDRVLAVAEPRIVLAEGDVDRLSRPGNPVPALDPDPERVVAIVFTSGTTGTPKGAVFGERELDAIARSDVPGWDDPQTWGGGGHQVAATQFAHVGFMTKLPWYLRLGTTTHLLERWRAADVLRLVSEHRMTSIGGVAPQLALLLRHPDFESFDLSSVQTIVMGGAFSPPALVEEARRRIGASYSIRYSSTESGGVGTGTGFDADDQEALHTVGRPRRSVELEIRSDDGRVLPSGEVGEVYLRSPCMMRGYWRDPDATAATIVDGWLRTGDLGWLDERGCLHLAGRKKEMYIRGGYNVYPVEVEGVLASHPEVAEVAVAPAPDPVMGEFGVAVVVPRNPERPPTLRELQAFAGRQLASYKLPEAIQIVEELPLTAMQKLDRQALAHRVAGLTRDRHAP